MGLARNGRILALLAVVAFLYLLFPSRVPECDAVIYSSAALRGVREMTFDPGHLAFGPLVAAAAAAGRAARPPLNPVAILQVVAMAAALAGAWAFGRTLTGLGVARGRAALFTAVLAGGYAWWHYALQAESHMISTALLVVFLLQASRTVAAPTVRGCAWAGLWLALATLMHQKNVLLAGAALPALALAFPDARRSLRGVAAFLVILGAVAGLPYLLVGWGALGLRTVPDFELWLRGLSASDAWGGWHRGTPLHAAMGLVRSLVGLHFLLRLDFFRTLAEREFPHSSLEDEFAVGAAVPGPVSVLLLALSVALLAVAALALLRRLVRPRVAGPGGGPLTILLWAWVGIVAVFAAWWAPARAEFWLDLFPPLLALLALPAAGRCGRAGGSRLVAAFALALALVNFLGSVRPQSLAALEPESAVALALDAAVRPGDVVLADIPFAGRASRYARAFEPVDLLAAGPEPEDRLRRVDSLLAAAKAAGRDVHLLVTPLGPPGAGRTTYAGRVAELAGRHRIGAEVPVRAAVELRRIEPGPGTSRPGFQRLEPDRSGTLPQAPAGTVRRE